MKQPWLGSETENALVLMSIHYSTEVAHQSLKSSFNPDITNLHHLTACTLLIMTPPPEPEPEPEPQQPTGAASRHRRVIIIIHDAVAVKPLCHSTTTTSNQFAAQSRFGINSPCPLFPARVFLFHGSMIEHLG